AVGLLLDQQPQRPRPGAIPTPPTLSRPDAQPGEAARQLPLGPLPPGHATQPDLPGQLAQGNGTAGRGLPSASCIRVGRRPRPDPAGSCQHGGWVKTTKSSVTPTMYARSRACRPSRKSPETP